ncbi:MAG TPA: HEAT repeat domain-containing protein, partial [Planctomycetota bacterium]|nr:HEAT repeat domain-containing protein [Planctomycetota bacterium]
MSSFRRARNLSRSFLLLTISAAVFGAPLSSCNYPGPAAFRAWYTLSAQEREEGSGAVPPADAPAPALDDPYLDELLGRALRSTYPEERRMAMDAIGDLGGRAAAALPYIVPSLGDPEPRVREKVIDSLRDISVRAGREAAASVAQALAKHLGVETDPRLRRDTIQALAKTAQSADPSTAIVVADALTAMLGDPDPRLAERAASAIGDVLGRARSDLQARRAFLEARGRMGVADPGGDDGLVEIERQIAALDEAAGRAVDALGARLRFAHGDMREEIIESVGRLGPAGGRTLAILAEALRDP